jgi:hypothetical protein
MHLLRPVSLTCMDSACLYTQLQIDLANDLDLSPLAKLLSEQSPSLTMVW